MKIKLNDNTELNAICINGKSSYYQGLNRNALEFVFTKGDYTFDELDALFADNEKTNKITITGTETQTTVGEGGEEVQTEVPVQYVYNDYSLRVSMEMRPVVITPETSTEPEVTEERIMVTMAQLSLIETKLITLGLM